MRGAFHLALPFRRGPIPPIRPAPVARTPLPGSLNGWERWVRIFLGAALCWLGWITVDGPLAAGLGVLGALFLVTGVAGACPIYALFGLDSRRPSR